MDPPDAGPLLFCRQVEEPPSRSKASLELRRERCFTIAGGEHERTIFSSDGVNDLDGFDVEVVRSDQEYRGAVKQSFQVLKDRLDSLVEEKPSRMISFDEEV